MLKHRPFVSMMIAREVRRSATRRLNANQFTPAQHDQFIAKLRTKKVVDAVCDFLEAEEDFDIRNLGKVLMTAWSRLRKVVEEFPDVSLEAPELHYNMAPVRRGRKARREAGPRYQDDPEFIADRDAFREEMNEKPTSGTTEDGLS